MTSSHDDKDGIPTPSALERIRNLPIMDPNANRFTYPMAAAALEQGANALREIATERDQLERALHKLEMEMPDYKECCALREKAECELAEARAGMRGACHDAAEQEYGCFRAVRAERELAETKGLIGAANNALGHQAELLSKKDEELSAWKARADRVIKESDRLRRDLARLADENAARPYLATPDGNALFYAWMERTAPLTLASWRQTYADTDGKALSHIESPGSGGQSPGRTDSQESPAGERCPAAPSSTVAPHPDNKAVDAEAAWFEFRSKFPDAPPYEIFIAAFAYGATAPSATEPKDEYICKCGLRVTPHRCSTGTDF